MPQEGFLTVRGSQKASFPIEGAPDPQAAIVPMDEAIRRPAPNSSQLVTWDFDLCSVGAQFEHFKPKKKLSVLPESPVPIAGYISKPVSNRNAGLSHNLVSTEPPFLSLNDR